MSESSTRQKQETFNNIRNDVIPEMAKIIRRCNLIEKKLSLPKHNIPNVIVAYNNKIIEIEKEFSKAGIDFYDPIKCKTRFIIENQLQSYILLAKYALNKYISIINISKEQLDAFVNSYKKPSLFAKVFKKAKYHPKKSVLNPQELLDAKLCIEECKKYYEAIYSFTLKDSIVDAILYYSILLKLNGTDIEYEFVSSIDNELKTMGYPSILDKIKEEFKLQDLAFACYEKIK